jgi:5-methylcytosine-specific restriction endonuclease McrA
MDIASADQIYAKLEANRFKCALTGWDLTPENFAIDHIQSLADGGSNAIDNLECVHPLANTAKGTMGKAQFVEMCMAVAKWQSEKNQGTSRL